MNQKRYCVFCGSSPGAKPEFAEAARALAQTGDNRAVRYFNRSRILERAPDRRELAREMHGIAAKRHAENSRAAVKR